MILLPAFIDHETLDLFSRYMKVVGVPQLEPDATAEPGLFGKKLGLLNGSAWIQLWSYYFGRLYLPGVKLINLGNEAVQLNFMQAHAEGGESPPPRNIELFARYARDLVELADIDAVLITCSTMSRSFVRVQEAICDYGVPVLQIDQPMMEKAVMLGGRILIVATHGPTVTSTRRLLEETVTAKSDGKHLKYAGATVEKAFDLLGEGRIEEHNQVIAETIRTYLRKDSVDQVLLAQLSMSVFKLSYPDAEAEFGVPVLTSGEEGFKRMREILLAMAPKQPPTGMAGFNLNAE